MGGMNVVPLVDTIPKAAGNLYSPRNWGNGRSILSGSSQYISYSLPNVLTTNLTLSAWARSAGGISPTATIVSLGTTGARGGFGIQRFGGFATGIDGCVSDTNGSSRTTAGSSFTSTTQHACLSHSGTTASLYINGALIGTATRSAGSMTRLYVGASTLANSFGEYASSMPFIGMPMALTRALSAAEVARLYAEQLDNPWQVLAPKRVWFPVSAASGPPTLAAITASNLTASGARLTVT